MSFWKKLFSGSPEDKNVNSENDELPRLERYRQELAAKNLSSLQDLEDLVTPLLRTASRMVISNPSKPPEENGLRSHFGGLPYFEEGDEWPTMKNGTPLDFIFQIYNDGSLNIPKDIRMIQFFYNWEASPWDSDEEGWSVNIRKTISEEKKVQLSPTSSDYQTKYCMIAFEDFPCLPDWEGIDRHCPDAVKLSCVLDEEEPWGPYDDLVQKLTDAYSYPSMLGGYQRWIQGDATPHDSKGETIPMLFQLKSEEQPHIMWGDAGSVYIFYDAEDNSVDFTLQCS